MFKKIRTVIAFCVWFVSYLITRPFTRLFGTVRVHYEDGDLGKIQRPVIIASNHKGSFDPWFLVSSLPFSVFMRLLPIRPLVSRKFSEENKVGRFVSALGLMSVVYYLYNVIPVPSVDSFEGKIHPLVKALNNDETVLMFPEGRIVSGEDVRDLKKGIVHLQQRTDVPILPCGIRYDRRGFFLYDVHVSFGKPLFIPKDLYAAADDEGYATARRHLREKLVELYHSGEKKTRSAATKNAKGLGYEQQSAGKA